MAKRGRPGIPYEKFVVVWEQLINDNRASTNAATDILGGDKRTIAGYRERYDREKMAKELAFIKSIEMTEAVHRAIAGVKVKENEALEKENIQLKSRIDDHLTTLGEVQEKLAQTLVEFDNVKINFDVEKLKWERKLAAAQARIDDLKQREQDHHKRYEQRNEQYNEAKKEAAVAKKEVELLREQAQET